ncbi:uncharacterized protein G2W53_043031 [Senna tora]|uniref:Uncharacterized protein n=1 Tax=Senna tora TaxID=362788 RepID=A0A834SGB2_9FABA|nr:uncharacterized protein G2W53_043031 [Senna tora]
MMLYFTTYTYKRDKKHESVSKSSILLVNSGFIRDPRLCLLHQRIEFKNISPALIDTAGSALKDDGSILFLAPLPSSSFAGDAEMNSIFLFARRIKHNPCVRTSARPKPPIPLPHAE